MKHLNRNEYWSFGDDDALQMATVVFGVDPRDMPIVNNRNCKPPKYPTGDETAITSVYSWITGSPARRYLNQLHQYKDQSIEYTRRIVSPYFDFEDAGDRNTIQEYIEDAKQQIANSNENESVGYHGLKTSDL